MPAASSSFTHTPRLVAFAAQAPPAPPTTTEERSQSFRAVTGGENLTSGETLLVEAYAAIWIIAFLLILLGWRRQRRIDERIALLEAAVLRARDHAARPGGAD